MYLRLFAGGHGCSQDVNSNGGNLFIHECALTDEFVGVADRPNCCEVTTSGACCT
ncbi:hypothetical protein BDR07DRAFT_1367988 [Suillus spraguei]|nr:hypothetical protein BDR07DRAFT_1367988 [Suillus spraguei]